MRETDIVYERGNLWIGRLSKQYTVYRNGPVHATADSSYPLSPDWPLAGTSARRLPLFTIQ